ncbi:hypothetical protein BaRGS_00040219 [Batillaria attramentaria]|uniref:Ribosomal protein L2 n=1 Tax=Batillaria attramentaria TaxID=370345 RepID=A0ABD0J138_9CAEN
MGFSPAPFAASGAPIHLPTVLNARKDGSDTGGRACAKKIKFTSFESRIGGRGKDLFSLAILSLSRQTSDQTIIRSGSGKIGSRGLNGLKGAWPVRVGRNRSTSIMPLAPCPGEGGETKKGDLVL